MYKNKKISAVITARMGSTRLSAKMNLKFGNDVVLGSVIKRLMQSKLIDYFILATTTNQHDDKLISIANKYKIKTFRGDECDVLGRIFSAVARNNPDTNIIVRACADNPLLMPSLVDNGVASLIDNNLDVITPFEINTLPFGFSMVSMTKECLEKINSNTQDKLYREHVENYCFEHSNEFNVGYQVANIHTHYPWLYATLDYELDYSRLLNINSTLNKIAIEDQPEWLIKKIINSGIIIVVDSVTLLIKVIDILTHIDINPKYVLLKPNQDKDNQVLHQEAITAKKYAEINNIKFLANISIREAHSLYLFSSVIGNRKYDDFIDLPSSLNIFYMNITSGYSLMNFNIDSNNEYEVYTLPSNYIKWDKNSAFSLLLDRSIYFISSGFPREKNQNHFWLVPKEKKKNRRNIGFTNTLSSFFPNVIYINLAKKEFEKVVYMDHNLFDKFLTEISFNNQCQLVILNNYDLEKNSRYIKLLEKLELIGVNYKVETKRLGIDYFTRGYPKNLFEELGILVNGDIVCYKPGENPRIKIGNLANMSISLAWGSKLAQSSRVNSINKIGMLCQVQN